MSNPNSSDVTDIEHDPAYVAAAEWLLKLQDTEITIDATLAWQAWLNESPRHAEAFARLEELAQLLPDVPAHLRVSARELERDRYDGSVPLKEWSERRFGPRLYWVSLGVAAVLAGIAFALVTLFWHRSTSSIFTTAIGENSNITLSDGSTVALGGDTRIEVVLSAGVRAIELSKGEALFRVAKDPLRPFKVRVGDATIVALGTAFDVQRDSDRAVVAVTEGRVLVEPVAHFLPVSVLQGFRPKLRAVHLDAGQQTVAGRAGIEDPTEVEDKAAPTAWQTGRLAFRLQPLRYVLEDVNRYARKPIVLDSPGLGALVITGTVERDHIAGWISSLERLFDLQATEESDRIVIRAR
ncbi:MAG TPA: FecR domain-containing protein [Steroidobacteraceae bacterium]